MKTTIVQAANQPLVVEQLGIDKPRARSADSHSRVVTLAQVKAALDELKRGELARSVIVFPQ